MRNVYLVSYDVADSKRLRMTYSLMLGNGDSVEYALFYGELSPTERQWLKTELWDILEFDENRVMLTDLGPAGGCGDECMEFWGVPRTILEQRGPTIV